MESQITIKASNKAMVAEFNKPSNEHYMIKYFERTGTNLFSVIVRHEELPKKLSGTFTFSSLKKKLM